MKATRSASKSHQVKPEILFNFGYVKKVAQPGSWRRGYGYFRANQVQETILFEEGVKAKVKGNFKDAYSVELRFSMDSVEPVCDCPLEEKWCKHAVVVALESIDKQLWEQFWGLPVEDTSDKVVDPQGSYRFVLNPKINQKQMGLKIIDRKTNRPVPHVEKALMAAIDRQSKEGFKPNEVERREFNVFQHLIKIRMPKTNRADGYFVMPLTEAQGLIPLLSQVEELNDNHNNRLIFEQTTLKLLMGLNVSLAGNVLVSFHWVKPDPYDVYPLEEVSIFAKDCPWGRYKNRIYPLSTPLSMISGNLVKTTFTDIRDADGGKFMYEELPRIRKFVEIDEADIVEQLSLHQRPPQRVVKLELVDNAALRLRVSLSFSYDGVDVPYSKGTPDTPYVMVVKKDKESLYWVKRDTKLEEQSYQQLVSWGLDPMQTNYFQAEGDDAIDFYNLARKGLGDGWKVKMNEKDLAMFKSSDDPLRIRAEIEFSNSVDAFILRNSCFVGERELDLDEVQAYLMQGKKYFFMDGVGFVEVPLALILQFQRTLQAFDAEPLSNDAFQIQTFKVGLIAEFIDQGVDLKMSKKFKKFWDVVSASTDMEEIEMPEKVDADLRPYQKRGYNWLWFLYSYGLNGILADDMGLGKTVQALTVLQQARDRDGQKPSLVVCPTSIVFNWENEIRRFTPELTCVNLTGPNRYDVYKKVKDVDIVITSYAILRRDINALKNYGFRYVILDESQYIKNADSQTAKSSKKLQCQHRLALSGTPIENRLSELWSVFDFLMPTFLYDMDTFRYKYITPIEEKGNREAERRLKKQVFPFILRRMKQDVMEDLPPKIENLQYCTMTDKQQELYLEVLESMRDEILAQASMDGVDKAKGSIFTLLLRLRQICCHPQLLDAEMSKGLDESGKFDALQDMLEDIISNGHRVLLFSQFVEMLNIIKKRLELSGIPFEYLTGQTRNRQEVVERFNRDTNIPVFLISLKAGGTGLNLTGADYVIHYDPWWNPMAEDQATDRAHRIGQTKTVFVYRLITKGTVEEKIVKLQGRKRSLIDSIIRADRSMGKFLSFEDLKEILSPDF